MSEEFNCICCDPMIRGGLMKHTTYKLKGNSLSGEFDIYRRYSDFHALRHVFL